MSVMMASSQLLELLWTIIAKDETQRPWRSPPAPRPTPPVMPAAGGADIHDAETN
jgi:hypothetical protein